MESTEQNLQRVPVKLAFEWQCPKCGLTNFESNVVVELGEEERREAIEDGFENPSTGDFVTHPDEAICVVCKAKVELHSDEDEDEEVG